MKKLFFALPVIFIISITTQAAEFNVDKSKNNVVKFISDAPIEDFEGVTNLIDGYIYYEGEDLTNNSQLYFEVDLSSLDTGIGLRNRHMRDNYLETDKFRYATYKGTITNNDKISNNTFEVEVKGTMNIHGVTKNLNIYGTLTENNAGLRIVSQFNVNLLDYNIDVPQVMFLKISEIMDLRLDFYMKEK